MNRRHIHIVCLVLLLFIPYLAFAQGTVTPITYQYWLDDNTDAAITDLGNDAGDGLGINLNLDVGSLSPGVHYYNIRAAEDEQWGAVQRFIFSIPTLAEDVPPSLIVKYIYWLDDDYEHRVETPVGDDDEEFTTTTIPAIASFDVSSLSPGVHYYNVRILDSNDKYSTTQRYIFSIPAASSGEEPADLQNVEYWIDDDYANRVTTTASGSETTTTSLDISEIDVSGLAPGVHYYNMRAQDADGIWGTTQRFIFSIPSESSGTEPADLQNVEYWIDDDFANHVATTASGSETTTVSLDISEIDVSSLAPGVHYYNMRAQDADGIWGTTQRFIFSIPAESSGIEPADLQNVEYWIDDDFANRVTTTASDSETTTASLDISEIDVSSLAPGIHYYNMRAQDANGIWGVTQRFIFSIPAPQQQEVEKDITGYSYSFNSGTPNIVTFDSPVDEFEQPLSFDVPSPGTLMVVDDSCKFEFDATNSSVKMRRYTPMSFTLIFIDESNAHSAPLVEEFVVVDSLTQDVASITSPGTYTIDTHADGGFTTMSFEVTSSTTLALRTNADCALRLYDSDGELLNAYEADAMQEGVSKTFNTGTFYAVFYGNTEDTNLGFYPGDETGMDTLKPTISYDEDSHAVTISSALDGAIYYTTDGSDPTLESTQYTAAFTASSDMTVKAIAAWGDMVVSPSRSYSLSNIKGDADNDGTIDIADVTAIINFILGNPSESFAENLADMNGDGVVDIFDAMLLLNFIINNITNAPAGATRKYSGVTNEPTEQIMLAAEQENIYVGLDQPERFTAFQFDLTLPAGTELSDVRLVSDANTHRIMFAHHGEKTYRVIGYSLKNELLPSVGDKLIELQLSDATDGNVSVDNILFVTPNEQKVWMAAKSIGSATQIDGVEMDTEAKDIYKLNGQKLDNSRKQLDKGVYIINQKKVIIK